MVIKMNIIKKISDCNSDNHNNPAPMIAFLGDSVTQGCFLSSTNYDEAYHNKLRQRLNYLYPGAAINILNAGIAGTTADFGAERLERDVLSKHPDLCVVCFGLNDVGGLEEKIPLFKKSLADIFTRLQNAGIEVIYMTPNMLNTSYCPEKTLDIYKDYAKVTMEWQNGDLMDKYMDAARQTAKEHNVPVCDCYAIWKKLAACGVNPSMLLSNGINHPDPEMHDLFANELLRVMFN